MGSQVLGFTGTRFMNGAGARVGRAFSGMKVFDEYVTGACVGFDAVAGMAMVIKRPLARHRVIVPANRAQISRWWDSPWVTSGHVIVEEMPESTTYKDRNQAIVNRSTELFYCAAFPEDHPKSLRSGTWQTVRMAGLKGIPVSGIVLSEG